MRVHDLSSMIDVWLLPPSSNAVTFNVLSIIKSNQITFIVTSPQHKCLGEWNSYERAPDSAEKQQTIYLWTDSAKKQQTIYLWTDSAKKNNKQFTYGQTVQKNCTGAFTVLQTVQKQQFTYGQTVQKKNNNLHMDRQCKKTTTAIYIWTDSAKNNSNLHMDSTIYRYVNIFPTAYDPLAQLLTQLDMQLIMHYAIWCLKLLIKVLSITV